MSAGTVYVDYQGRERVPAMVIGGMTVIERVLREAARAGAARAIVRGDELPALPPLGLAVDVIPTTMTPPAEAMPIAGDVIAGVTVHDAASRRAASRALFQTCRRPHDGLGDRYVIRGISLPISRVLCRFRVTPNQVTWVNIVVGLVACAFAARGDRLSLAIAGVLAFLQVVLDSCDGEIARIRHMTSRFGMLLDNLSDDVIDNLFVAMLGVGIGGIWAPLAIAAACARGASAMMIHVDVARRGKPGDVLAFRWFFDKTDEDLGDRFETGTSLFGIIRAFGRRDLYVLVWAVTCVVGAPQIGLVLGIALSAAYFGLAIVHVIVVRR
ncbi:MAG: CDP-alcohol phosphatidyltransferase family protein [Deltaproteobacteria bacterium]|nr:CDP-alcohol phosphatidyltransferase family protein [Deltaproteobacteria bacterium]MDQ3296730.1 CDP-alcohol phosphatidyltransferase family protein [Myxococcota bacterium]